MNMPNSVQISNHRVDRLCLSLSLPSEHAHAVSQRCSQLFQRELRHLIERVLTRVASSGERISLRAPLVVDLGTLPMATFERGFCQRLETRLEQALRQHLARIGVIREVGFPAHVNGEGGAGKGNTTAPSFTGEERTVSQGNTATHARPPGSPEPPSTDEERAVPPSMVSALRQLERVLTSGEGSASALLNPWLLRKVEEAPDVWLPALAIYLLRPGAGVVRLRQLRLTTLRRLCALWVPPLPSPGQLTWDGVWLSALYHLQHHPDCPLPAVPDALYRAGSGGLETANDYVGQMLCTLFASACGPSTRPLAGSQPWLRRLWQVRAVRDVVLPRLSAVQASTLRQWLEEGEREKGESRATPTVRPRFHPLSLVPPVTRGRQQGDDVGLIAVDNAGLSLLWPQFPGLFRQQKWVQETRFVDQVAQQRAACCLGGLGEGRSVSEGDNMVLNALLCGLPPETRVVVDKQDDTLPAMLSPWLSQLLRAMPTPWHRISSADFRQWFIQRAGWLTRERGRDVLYIEPAVYDVLLRDWPWPTEMVALPWLRGPLTLKWQHPDQ